MGIAGADEREVKLAVPEGFVMPPLDFLEGVSVTDRGERTLDAMYWDTDDLDLARAGVGVRRRNGVWTFKGRSRREGDAVVREELEVEGGDEFPPQIAQRLTQWVDLRRLRPIAQVRTLRHQFDVAAGAGCAEVVHDRVSVRDGDQVVSRFDEVEVEFPAPSAALADRIVGLLLERGATVDPTAKYLRALRALGHDPPEVSD
jgi:inorganic triphosphatase YgiF